MKRAAIVVALLVLAAPLIALHAPVQAQSGWRVDDFAADYTIEPDGVVLADEVIQVDFGTESHHGINRDLSTKVRCTAVRPGAEPPLQPCPENSDRLYKYLAIQVSAADGRSLPFTGSESDGVLRLQIGDPKVSTTGKQSYRVHYEVAPALDAYSDHDELYWNATGTWAVPIAHTIIRVHLPAGASLQAACYEGSGRAGTAPCKSATAGTTATYESTRTLGAGEQLTFVTGWQRGLVTVQPAILQKRLTIGDFFTFDWIEYAGMVAVAVLSIAGLAALWWRAGRDRRYRTLYYLTNDASEQTQPLFAHTDVVVEFLPPDELRPAEMGVILDERADTRDVTATIIDLAVRGYLHITEIPKEGWFGHKDWKLTKIDRESDLRAYERRLYDSLFAGHGNEVKLSELKNTFASRLSKVKDELYDDAMSRKWFSARPEKARTLWLIGAFGVVAVGGAACFASGYFLGRALLFSPLILAGLALMPLSRAMARRTATGSEALRRVLGFRLYIATAETRMQEFNEQQNIFARYLPFAIVFGCVDKWAKAFKGLEEQAQQSTASWYTGVGAFEVMAFSSGLQGFAGSVSSSISSTPGSSGGGSGFSGGFAGGGGGGGGGSAW